MDQFNKILTILLVVFVAIGISTFIFYKLGLLKKILPNSSALVGNIMNKSNQQISPTIIIPIQISTSPTPPITTIKQDSTSLFGFLFRKTISPTPIAPQAINVNLSPVQTTNTPSQPIINTKPLQPPEVVVVPYGSTNVTFYPATGIPALFIPVILSWSIVGIYLKQKANK